MIQLDIIIEETYMECYMHFLCLSENDKRKIILPNVNHDIVLCKTLTPTKFYMAKYLIKIKT